MLEAVAEFMAKMRYYGDAIVVIIAAGGIALGIIVFAVSAVWQKLKGDKS